MSHTPDTSIAPNHVSNWNRFYTEWCKTRREFGMSCSSKFAGREWRRMTQSEKDVYSVQHHEVPEPSHVTEPLDNLYEEEDLVNNVVSLSDAPVKEEELFPASPLFSEFGPTGGSPAFGQFSTAGPSIFDQVSSIGPAPEPSFDMYQSPFTAFPPVSEGSPVASPSIPLYAPVPTYPIPRYTFPDGTDSPLPDETTYNHVASLPNAALPSQEDDWWNRFSEEMLSGTVPAQIYESDPSTAVPLTPTTGYQTLGFITPGYTPGSHIQDLPAELNNNPFALAGMEAAIPEQPIWDVSKDFEHVHQQSLLPSAPDFLTTAPTTALPVTPPAPPFPVPLITGQFDQNARFPGDPHPWNVIARTLESDPHLAVRTPVIQQNIPPTIVQHSFNVQHSFSVSSNGVGRDGKPIRLGEVQVWYIPARAL